jgi:hypothetical protein
MTSSDLLLVPLLLLLLLTHGLCLTYMTQSDVLLVLLLTHVNSWLGQPSQNCHVSSTHGEPHAVITPTARNVLYTSSCKQQ